MSNSLDPLQQIRDSCEKVFLASTHVSINEDKISLISTELHDSDIESLRNGVAWDVCGWHFDGDASVNGPLTCQYVFVMDALNFCFWPCPGLEYDTLASSLKKVIEADNEAFSAQNLISITESKLSSWFPENLQLPSLPDRILRLNELGQCLQDNFDGLASNMVKQANKSASKLVQLVIQHIPGFRDTSIYKGSLVHLYKRAQILVGDIWAAYGRQTSADGPYYFNDIHRLTMFADYRVPQILREMGVLEYSPALALKVDNCIEIAVGSEEEVEIRALTIVAVDKVHACLCSLGFKILVVELDWLLWQKGEAVKDDIRPHHRTRTIYY